MTIHASASITETDLNNYLSSAGVIAFADHDQSGTSDTDVVNNCINRATTRVLDYLGQQYTVNAAFIAHETVKDWELVIAAYVLCGLRGNPRPDSLAEDYQEICGKGGYLEQARAGNYQLYGLAKRNGKAPSFANVTIDRRHPYRKIRVKPNSSNVLTAPQTDDLADPSIDH